MNIKKRLITYGLFIDSMVEWRRNVSIKNVYFFVKVNTDKMGKSVSIQLHCTFKTEYYEKGRLHEQKN